jgi:hypothetical protein
MVGGCFRILRVAGPYEPCLRLSAVTMCCILESRFTDKLDISVVIDSTIEEMLHAFVCSRVFEERILIDRKTVQILMEEVKIGRSRAQLDRRLSRRIQLCC